MLCFKGKHLCPVRIGQDLSVFRILGWSHMITLTCPCGWIRDLPNHCYKELSPKGANVTPGLETIGLKEPHLASLFQWSELTAFGPFPHLFPHCICSFYIR